MASTTDTHNEAAIPHPHSDLEVHLPPPVPEVYGHSGLEAYRTEPAAYSGSGSERYEPPKLQDTPKRRVGRLSNRAFWALVAIAIVVIIAAALGGGLGGGLSRRPSAASATQPQTSSLNSETTNPANPTTATATATTPSSVQISLTEIANPTSTGSPSTLIRDCPSSNNTIYSARFGSTDFEFRKICSQTIVNTGNSNAVSMPTISLNECIDLCAAWNANSGTPPCQTVCWRNGFLGDDYPGQCFGFQTTNTSTSTGFEITPDEPICDSAVWINQP